VKNIIFICGAGGDKGATYAPALKEFCEKLGYKFYFPAMPGFDEEITYNKYSRSFENTLNQIDETENTIVIAQSAGNWFFVKYLYEHDIRFHSFISCATAASVLDKPFESTVKDKLLDISKEFMPTISMFDKFRKLPFENKVFLYGGKDRFFSRDAQEAWGSLIGAQKWFIEDMPHFTTSENIKEFKELHNLIQNNFQLKNR